MNDKSSDSVILAVVESIAKEEGIGVTEVYPPLSDVIDADSLSRAIESMDDGHIVFSYKQYWITVDSNNKVELSERDPDLASNTERVPN